MSLTRNTFVDRETNITWHVMTPGPLSRDETITAIRWWLHLYRKKDWPKRNTECTITAPMGIPGLGFGLDR